MPGTTAALPFQPEESYAGRLDAEDPLRSFRDRFLLPQRSDGSSLNYLCGHSLGLQPKSVRSLVEQELSDWARLGVEGHFHGKTPWYSYHELLREAGAPAPVAATLEGSLAIDEARA